MNNSIKMVTEISPTLYSAIKYFIPRLILTGISWGDIVLSLSHIKNEAIMNDDFWFQWLEGWKKQAIQYKIIARKAFKDGHDVTAYDAYLKAASCYHWAEFMSFKYADEKYFLRQCVSHCFMQAIPSFPFDCQKILIPYALDNNTIISMPGYFLTNDVSEKSPCVFLINGLDSAKEVELFTFAKEWLKRGVSVFMFDAPGQGELLGKTAMPIHFEYVMEKCIEHLSNLNLINEQNIGLFGVSFGGYLALRCASYLGDRIKGCINLSGGFDIPNFEQMNSRIQEDFAYVFQTSCREMTNIAIEHIHLKRMRPPTSPILSIHGGFDAIFTLESCHKVIEWANSKAELVYYPTEHHVCQNRFQEYLPMMCDWMVKKMIQL